MRLAAAGGEILVTSHGRAIVRMTGVEQTPAQETEADAIAQLRGDRRVRAGTGGRVEPVSCPIRAALPGEPLLSDLLHDLKLFPGG